MRFIVPSAMDEAGRMWRDKNPMSGASCLASTLMPLRGRSLPDATFSFEGFANRITDGYTDILQADLP
jgi:hypothetical protein